MSCYITQPEFCRLPVTIIPSMALATWVPVNSHKLYGRIVKFDPTDAYNKIHTYIDPFKRYQPIGCNINTIFPTVKKGYCACGCGNKLTGKRTRWATDTCGYFAYCVSGIIKGDVTIIEKHPAIVNQKKARIHGVDGDLVTK